MSRSKKSVREENIEVENVKIEIFSADNSLDSKKNSRSYQV